jgi:Bifunctional DNA primase/polymerase, N-terminal/AAA domain
MTVRHTNLDVALRYAAAGFSIFPCDKDKRPLVASWATEATKDPARIQMWWTAQPKALVGLPMKPHGLLVFDADRHHENEDGIGHFRALCAKHEPLPPHPIVLTANGGEHHIFRQPTEKIGNRKLGNGLETRGYKDDNDGGYVIAAGSRLPDDGRSWRLADGSPSLLNATLPEPPAWLIEHAPERREEQWQPASSRSAGKREEAYAAKALDNLARDIAAMPKESGRNNQLNIAALKLGGMIATGWIGRATVEGRLFDACVANGLVEDTGANAVRGTIRSGLEAGLKLPHADLQDRNEERAQPARQASQRSTSWREGLMTAKALQTKTFAPVRIIVPGLIPEGVTILAGKPKIGKSWLALDICAAVAGDRFVLGETKPVQGHALYLALEDNQRRLKKRTDKILQSAANWPDRLEMHTEWKRMDNGGLEDIEAWCQEHPERPLIWVDTLAKIRPVIGRSEQAYAADYRAIEGLQKLAGEYQVGIVLNHHLRKMSSEDDAFDDVSGTLGLTGAADTIIVMKRHSGMMKVFVRGRDIEEAEFAAEFNKTTCRWRLVGEADEVFRSEQRQAIATALKETARPMSVAEIMAATERRDRHSTEALLAKMERDREVKHVGRGQWAHPDTESHPTESVVIVGKARPAARGGSQPLGNTEEFGAAKTQRQTQRKHNAPESVVIPVVFPESANSLADRENPVKHNEHNEHNGTAGADDYPDLSECLRRSPNGNGFRPPRGKGWHLAGDLPQGQATVWLKEVWPPALGPPGDDVLDFEPGWRQ